MSLKHKLAHELKAVAVAALYFACWIGALLVLKFLLLTEYKIAFRGWSIIVMGALILSKVVLILEHVSLGAWVRSKPAWVDVVLRTALYSAGLVVVLILEKGIEGRHEHGGFAGAVEAGFRSADAYHIYINTICLSGALFVYNALAVLRRHLGEKGLLKLFLVPLPPKAAPSGSSPESR